MDLFKRKEENDRQFIFRMGRAKEQGLIDLSWQELTDIFNRELTDIKGKADKLSASTYQQQYRIALLYYEDVFEHMDNSSEAQIALIEEKKQELYKEKVKVQDAAREYRKTLRDEARVETLLTAIKSNTKDLTLQVIPYEGETEGRESEGVLCVGDWHIGATVHNFRNDYNLEIAKRRLNKLAKKTIEYCRKFKLKKLHVINLSDLIEGEIHVSTRVENEIDTIEQIKVATSLMLKLLTDLSSSVPEIYYRSVVDNHSRLMVNYKEHIEKESFCKLIDWGLEEGVKRLNEKFEEQGLRNKIYIENDNIDDNIGLFHINNNNIFFSHGHQGSPNTVVQDLSFGTNIMADYVLLGHWHVDKVKDFQGKKVYFNGSLKGVDNYTLSKRMFADPSQTLLIFEGEDVVNIPINLVRCD